MAAETLVAVAFLLLSAVSLLWHGVTLYRIACNSDLHGKSTFTYIGLLRTATCRTCVSGLYVGVGVNALFTHRYVLITTFAVFCVVQLVWQLNSLADLRLSRRISAAALGPGVEPNC